MVDYVTYGPKGEMYLLILINKLKKVTALGIFFVLRSGQTIVLVTYFEILITCTCYLFGYVEFYVLLEFFILNTIHEMF